VVRVVPVLNLASEYRVDTVVRLVQEVVKGLP
jgi:hypothetical protein